MPQSRALTPLTFRLGLAIAIVSLTTIAYLGQSVLGPRGQAAIGVVCFLGVALTFSTNIRAINWRTIATGFLLQVFLAIARVGELIGLRYMTPFIRVYFGHKIIFGRKI